MATASNSSRFKYPVYKPYAPGRTSAKEKKATLIERDGAICCYCGRINVSLTVDHVIPLCRRGTNSIDNLVLACASCNYHKNDLTPIEWLMWEYGYVIP